jgi:hypothetical protein
MTFVALTGLCAPIVIVLFVAKVVKGWTHLKLTLADVETEMSDKAPNVKAGEWSAAEGGG